jgi:hypothetical protein
MIGRFLLSTCAIGLALSSATAIAQIAVPGPAETPPPPVAPTEPSQRPEEFGRALERGQSVLDRPRPEYDPLGVHLGSFFLYPKLEVDELYNDNVFAAASRKKGDFVTVASPTLDLRSNWSSHALDLRAGASVGTYASQSSENYGDYFVSATGRYDISRYLAALGGAKYEHLHEERDSPDAPGGAANPVQFDAYTGTVGLAQTGLKVGYEGDFVFHREDYSNVNAVGGGTLIETVRNVNNYVPSVRVTYELAPRYQAFVRGEGTIRQYDNSKGAVANAPDRDSQGYRADVGAAIDLTGVTYIEVFGGYLEQFYKAPLSSIHGIDAGARVVWNVTELTSVSLNGSRSVQDENSTTLTSQGASVNSPGYLRSLATLSIDHELFRNVLLHGEVSYENDNFVGINRSDDRYDAGFGARYLLNRNLYLGASYTYTRRDSGGSNQINPFSRNLFLIRLGTQL